MKSESEKHIKFLTDHIGHQEQHIDRLTTLANNIAERHTALSVENARLSKHNIDLKHENIAKRHQNRELQRKLDAKNDEFDVETFKATSLIYFVVGVIILIAYNFPW